MLLNYISIYVIIKLDYYLFNIFKDVSKMKKYLIDHINKMESILKESSENVDLSKIKKEHLVQIQFLQHERLIHFLVTFYLQFC